MPKKERVKRAHDNRNHEPTEAGHNEAMRDVEGPDLAFGYCVLCRRVEAEMNCVGSATLDQHLEACEKANCGHPPFYAF